VRCRHVGDLGNVVAANGAVETTINDFLVTLFGNFSVIGRSFVVSILQNYTQQCTCTDILKRIYILLPSIANAVTYLLLIYLAGHFYIY